MAQEQRHIDKGNGPNMFENESEGEGEQNSED